MTVNQRCQPFDMLIRYAEYHISVLRRWRMLC
jgi:hypothetical protein